MARVPIGNLKGPRGATGATGPRGVAGAGGLVTDEAVADNARNEGTETNEAIKELVTAGGLKPLLVNPNGLDRWRKRHGEAFFEPVGAICQGTSISDGAWANNAPTKTPADQQRWADGGFVGQLRRLIAATYGDPGEGLRNFTGDDSRWTVVGAQGATATGVASTAMRFNTGGTATCTVPDGTSSVRVPFMTYPNAGVVRVLVDGVDATPTRLSGGRDALTSGWGAIGATIGYVTEGGSSVVEATVTAAGNVPMHSGIAADSPTVVPGAWYMWQAEVKPTVNNRSVVGSMIFLDDAGTVIAGEEKLGDTRVANVNGYKQVVVIAQAPVGAARVAGTVRATAATVGDKFRIRAAKLTALATVREGALGAMFASYTTPIPSGSHTVQIVTGTGVQTDVMGLIERGDPDAKIRIHGSALSGSTSRAHARPDLNADGRTNLMLGTYAAIEGQPALVILELGANDYNRQDTESITPTEYKANLQLLINTINDMGASTLLVAGPRWADDSKTFSQDDFYDKARELALSNAHVSFFDLKEAWGDWDSADAKGFMWDSPHPNLAGHGDFARIVWSVITRPTEPA